MKTIEQKRKFCGKMIWISAIFLVLSVCADVALPVLGMINAFSSLRATGATDPKQLAGEISAAIMVGMLAIPFALFVIAIMRHRKFSNPTIAG